MTLIRDGAITEDDFVRLADDVAIPSAGKVLIGWDRWSAELSAPVSEAARFGVQLPNTLDVVDQWPQLQHLALIALSFPAFADGRAYSQARLLRDRLGFKGELRAVGNAVVRDQMQSLNRCGFNSFELRADQDAAECIAALHDFSRAYQPAADHLPGVFGARRRAAATANPRRT